MAKSCQRYSGRGAPTTIVFTIHIRAEGIIEMALTWDLRAMHAGTVSDSREANQSRLNRKDRASPQK